MKTNNFMMLGQRIISMVEQSVIMRKYTKLIEPTILEIHGSKYFVICTYTDFNKEMQCNGLKKKEKKKNERTKG